ncbi:uncharacterized protein UV8b_04662 [Ustilaginoidea virens]|uniref:FAD-binding domain-containing protein n=1 Tax=Ustilaginoidea virens TaxID=1159556 RepID=A0A8E5MI68_USTVR|nr:uncharacterized protein UV8b_04662 [Ustilaginoidea virens]QUC20421.1 hypothetical protein UV8b_04662 [Ustilaginoidea virens]
MAATVVRTELLIVGAGPAGASLACFLGSHGRTGIIISAAPGTAETPRAHITNMAALECLRDIGLDRECTTVAAHGDNMQHTRWCMSMAGEELARAYSWGHDPFRKGDYETASPCEGHIDLPQTDLEPILIRRATHDGWAVRFSTTLLKISQNDSGEVISEVRDSLTGQKYLIQSRYAFGCDGARSQVVREVGIPLIKKPTKGLALNILIRADMSHLIKDRKGNLHWVVQPQKGCPPWGWAGLFRMVKPWTEWMAILMPHPGADMTADDMEATEEEYVAHVKQMIGDESVEPEILNVSKWWINETVAEYYSVGNVFCLGDAVHRHPPFNGLGSNTCIQDAFNLAWKISHVMSGKAGPGLLDTFSIERQPAGVDVVRRANQGLRDHSSWMETVGLLEPDMTKRREILAEFDDAGPKGRLRRAEFQRAIEQTASEFHGLGVEMNQFYSSSCVYREDEAGEKPEAKNSTDHYHVTTKPGSRLPHAWLNSRVPGPRLSTIDLAGHGRFCLLTGPGGQGWKEAAQTVSGGLGVDISCYSIGWRQDYEDVYFDWARRREVEEDGCILARPDRFVAWRCPSMPKDCASKLRAVMTSILSL